MEHIYGIGVDIGGSHITSVLVELKSGVVVEETQFKEVVDCHAGADEILEAWRNCINQSLDCVEKGKVKGIGIAMPGPFDYLNGISLIKGVGKFDHLYEIDIRRELKSRLDLDSSMDIRFINDAMAFAIGESWMGVAQNKKKVIALTLGTGFGSSFLIDGVPQISGEGIPEMGYVYNIPYKDSIADDYFSTRGLVRAYFEKSGVKVSGVHEISILAEKGDVKAQEMFCEFGEDLGGFIKDRCKDFPADEVVIGGNISKAFPMYEHNIKESLSVEKGVSPEICVSTLLEQSALSGAARLVDDEYWLKVEGLISKL